jgi:hypothetical protein
MNEAPSRFSSRELTVHEMLLMLRLGNGDMEAGVAFAEARRIDPGLDLRNMPVTQFYEAVREAMEMASIAMGFPEPS